MVQQISMNLRKIDLEHIKFQIFLQALKIMVSQEEVYVIKIYLLVIFDKLTKLNKLLNKMQMIL